MKARFKQFFGLQSSFKTTIYGLELEPSLCSLDDICNTVWYFKLKTEKKLFSISMCQVEDFSKSNSIPQDEDVKCCKSLIWL